MRIARRWALGVVTLAVLAGGSGCIAIPVGRPETFTKEIPGAIREVGTPQVVSRHPRERILGRDSAGRRIAWIGLEGEIVSEQEREQTWQRVGIVKQRRMAVGFCPAGAEHIMNGDFAPEMDPSLNMSADYSSGWGLGMTAATPWKLIVEPFYGSWECKHHKWKAYGDGEAILKHFSKQERQTMGLEPTDPNDFMAGFSHAGLAGFHRHCKYTVQEAVASEKRTPAEPATTRRIRKVQGPYRIALEFPGCGFSMVQEVLPGATGVDFDLGELHAAADTEKCVIRFLQPTEGTAELRDADDRALLEMVAGQSFSTSMRVKALEQPSWPAGGAPSEPRTLVKEYHHYHETKVEGTRSPQEAPWEIETVEAYRGGRAEYRVAIRDPSLKAFEVEREVKPEIERLLRESFLAARPGMDPRAIRAYALPEFDGRTIRFKGVAFSVQPLTDGWQYDADTRRGSVRLRISEGMLPDEAKRWARDNIETIVKEKNVALEAGVAPPSGAMYRSLGESLEDGVLTVEFEAVE